MPTLKQGASGPYVIELKRRLAAAGFSGLDGPAFDAETRLAVMEFQRDHTNADGRALEPDGEVGDETWAALGGAPSPMRELSNHRGYTVAGIALHEAMRGVREQGGNNKGTDVQAYQAATGLPGTGWAWCAAFVTWCYERAGLVLKDASGFAAVAAMKAWAKRSGYWRAREPGYCAPVGSVVVFKISHTGIVIVGGENSDQTVEGNTSSGVRGSQRDGDGVFQRSRDHHAVRGYVVVPEILLEG